MVNDAVASPALRVTLPVATVVPARSTPTSMRLVLSGITCAW